MNRGEARRGGYTIVETLIFLAVSGVLFVSAMLLISGRQAKTQFTNSVRDLISDITDVANDVANGYYQTGSGLNCTPNLAGPDVSLGNNNAQGTNKGCIFVGRTMRFSAGEENNLTLYTLAGNQNNNQGKDVKTLAEAKPKVVSEDSYIQKKTLGYGLQIICIGAGQSCTPGDKSNAAISFFTRLTGGIGDGISRGGLQTDVYITPSVSIDDSIEIAIDKINNDEKLPVSTQAVTICVSNGSSQYGLIHLGSIGSANLTVSSEIKVQNGGTLCA